MEKMKIAIISDLHIGDLARSNDLKPGNQLDETPYLDKFKLFTDEESISADYLIIPGDITNCGKNMEFAHASSIIIEIAKALSVDNEKIIFVPGNHDANWDVMEENDTTGISQVLRYSILLLPQGNQWIFKNILDRGEKSLLEKNYFTCWEFSDLLVVGYNSSWHDDSDKGEHYGSIDINCIKEFSKYLDTKDLSSKAKIFLLHHHVIQYGGERVNAPDFSITVNALEIQRMLGKYQFDFIINGHKHKPKFDTIILNSNHPLAIITAGSFSARLDADISDSIANQFHLLNVERRDINKGNLLGTLFSWAYNSHRGWIPSEKDFCGIQHICAFGEFYSVKEILHYIIPQINIILKERQLISWSEFKLDYLQNELLDQVLDKLEKSYDLEIFRSPNEIKLYTSKLEILEEREEM